MEKFQNALGYRFKDLSLIETALTHPSYGGDYHVPHYQRMEFLGDAVLELAVSRYLFYELPDVDEGKLTRIRAEIVREKTLCQAARKLDLGRLIRLSVGEEHSGGRDKPSILADVMEAVFAAVYLDSGIDEAMRVIYRVLDGQMQPTALEDHVDAKTRLQEILQRKGSMPKYEFISMEGPPHAPVFYYRVIVDGKPLGEGSGSSKQAAQKQAAHNALEQLTKA